MGKEKYEGKPLGFVSAKFEGGGITAISHAVGDAGGASYGKPQFAANTGSLKGFVQSLNSKPSPGPEMYKILSGAMHDLSKGGAFDKAWLDVCKKWPKEFEKFQDDRIRNLFYDPARKAILKYCGIDIDKHHRALQEALWSTAVQFGPAGARKIFVSALGRYEELSKKHMNDQEMLKAVYGEKSRVDVWFRSSSEKIQESVKNRFKKELAMLLEFF